MFSTKDRLKPGFFSAKMWIQQIFHIYLWPCVTQVEWPWKFGERERHSVENFDIISWNSPSLWQTWNPFFSRGEYFQYIEGEKLNYVQIVCSLFYFYFHLRCICPHHQKMRMMLHYHQWILLLLNASFSPSTELLDNVQIF